VIVPLLAALAGFTFSAKAWSGGDERPRAGSPALANAFILDENSDDPGYTLFRTGYNMVMNEQWEEAHRAFQELATTFPESEYCDDALYWSGYVWFQNEDLGEAIDAYNRLIHEYPSSQYYDDAVADMTEAEMRRQVDQISQELQRSVATPHAQGMQRHLMDLQLQLERLTWNHSLLSNEEQELDPETQLRVDALNALSPEAGDLESIETLKEVALDKGNPVALRQHAVHILASTDEEQSFPVFVTLARDDTNQVLRVLSVDYLAMAPAEKSVGALIDVFQAIPPREAELSARVFYTIAEVGNDQAVDFLSGVARTHKDIALRREAIFYLGAIGSERSRAALHTILRGRD
jgi:tetratricopeptide (TPR) repeat protein